jgi:chemotaxis protein histidine kinase CheA
MAETTRIDIDAVINTGDSLQKLRALKKAQKEVVAGSAEFNKLAASIRDTEDALDAAKLGANDLAGALESAPGPVGAIAKGFKTLELNTKSFGTALKATGIGLLVALVGGLVAAFMENERAMKKLEPVMQAFQKILGGIFAAFEPVLDIFIEMVEAVLPYFTQYIGIVYSSLFGLFSFVKDVGVGVGKVLAGIFTQDFSMIEEGVEQVKNSIANSVDAGMEAYERFEAGSKELTASEKEQEEERRKAAEEAAKAAEEARRKAFEEKLKRMDAEDKLDEAMLNKQRAEVLALAQTEQEKLDIERKFAELSHQARLKDLEDRMKLYGKDSLEYKGLQTEKINAETEYITQQRAFLDQQKKLNDDANAIKLENEKKAREEERALRLFDLQQQLEELDKQNQMLEFDFEQDLERFAEQRAILAEQEKIQLQNEDLTELQKTEIRKKFADERKKITDGEILTEKAAQQAKLELQSAYLDLAGQFGNTLQAIAGKNKGLAIAGIVIEQAANIAKIVANTAAANAKSVAASPLTAGMPWVAINTASAALSIASTIASARKSIQQISSQPGSGGGGGGGGSLGAAPSFAAPGGMSAPQVNAGVGESPTSQIAQTIAMAQGKPIVAQVVSSAVSSQQALDRRTNGAATFGGG